jgi:GTPase SAR1 family protein
VKTTKREFTILLVGETGVGKTTVLSLIANILEGRTPEQYVDFHAPGNEAGGSQSGSQTKSAQVYEFGSKNGVIVRILDTPGLADTRGLAEDKKHKESIAQEIQRSIATVNAVIILANGTLPRLGASTDYALTTLSSIFPNTLSNNIGIMFTNVGDPLNCNFEEDAIPDILRHAKQFLLDNPVAIQKKFLQQKQKRTLQMAVDQMQKRVQASEVTALDTLNQVFDWLDALVPQPTKEIVYLHGKSQNIEKNIDSALARMTQAAEKDRDLQRIAADLNKAQVVSTYHPSVRLSLELNVANLRT